LLPSRNPPGVGNGRSFAGEYPTNFRRVGVYFYAAKLVMFWAVALTARGGGIAIMLAVD